MKKIKIVFFGTPEFAVASLSRLLDDGADIAAVVTMPDKAAGRGHKMIQSDVKKFAVEKGLPVLQPEKLRDPEFISRLREINADLFIVIAFRMLPEIVWSMPPLGTFNLHASLLPKYRGAAPINRAVMNGETETGVTTFFLRHEIDTGEIIAQQKIGILPEDNARDVHDKLMALGAEMVSSTVRDIEAGNVKSYPQPEGEFVAAPKIFKDTCRINWNSSAMDIHNHIRGLAPYPAAWSCLEDCSGKNMEVKIFTSGITAIPGNGEKASPGTCRIDGKRFLVATGDGEMEILELQPAGKKRMSASAFLLGYHPKSFC